MNNESAYYHSLCCLHHGEYTTLAQLLLTHGGWQKAYEQTVATEPPPPAELETLARSGVQLILRDDDSFPPLLREIPWPPHALYVRGELKNAPAIAVVGTRRASPRGKETARALTQGCVAVGLAVVSGLAFGVDAAAHEATLAANGYTIAVLASGIDAITPRSNASLGERILAAGGAIISEYPPHTEALPRFFIARNRIVSGLARAVVVVEAPKKSGTLATARFAAEQNRELLVIPGAIHDANYEGSHALIRSGATLITSTQDILEALGFTPSEKEKINNTQGLPFLDGPEGRIVELLSSAGEALTADAIAERAQLGVSVVAQALALLTIERIVKETAGTYYM